MENIEKEVSKFIEKFRQNGECGEERISNHKYTMGSITGKILKKKHFEKKFQKGKTCF